MLVSMPHDPLLRTPVRTLHVKEEEMIKLLTHLARTSGTKSPDDLQLPGICRYEPRK